MLKSTKWLISLWKQICQALPGAIEIPQGCAESIKELSEYQGGVTNC